MARNFSVKKVRKQMYPATHNFMDDADGAEPSGWTTNNGAGCTTTIITSLDGHRKVLQLFDNNGATRAEIYTNVTQGLNTTVEFLVRWDVNKKFFFDFYEGATVLGAISCDNDRIYWYNGGYIELKVGAVNTWYHVKVIFDDTANTVDCYVDGDLAAGGGEVYENNSTSGVDKINLSTDAGDSGYNFYIDAIGVSTDANYKIGDNVHWRHYKESTDSFEGDDVGTQGTAITWVDNVNSADDHEIVVEFNEHKKILRTYINGGTGDLRHLFPIVGLNGWVSVWVKVANTDANNHITELREGSNIRIRVRIDNDRFEYDAGAGYVDAGVAAVDNTWYHICLEWYSDRTFDLWVDNIQYLDGAISFAAFTDTGISRWYIDEDTTGANYLYIDAPISSLDGDERGDNRIFDYNDAYTREDVTDDVINVTYSNRLHRWRTATLYSKETYYVDEIFFQIYDIHSKLAMEADLTNRIQLLNNVREYPLLDKNSDDLLGLNNQTFSSAKIHDPTDSGSMLKTILPNVSEADGDLILVDADAKTDAYSPVIKNYPTRDFLRDISDLADSVVIIAANGKCYLDDDKASGDSLDIDIEADKDRMTAPPRPNDVAGINYWEVRGMINPTTGERFEKIVDNSGSSKKRRWRITNNSFRTQTDVDNYAAKLSTLIVAVKEITIHVQGFGAHNMGETFDYKYVDSVYNIPRANYYVIEERIDFGSTKSTILLSQGLAEISKYASSYERPQNYSDSYSGAIYESDITTIDLNLRTIGGGEGATGIGLANGDSIYGDIYISSSVDPERKMIFTLIWMTPSGDDVDGELTIEEFPCDGSSLSITHENHITHNIVECDANRYIETTYTLATANINGDSLYRIHWDNIDVSGIVISAIQVEYFLKRVLPP